MAVKYPYVTAPSYLKQLFSYLRASFPAQLSAATLKKLGIAPNNESSTISILRRLGLLDAAGNRTLRAAALFGIREEGGYTAALGALVQEAYRDLFDIRGEGAWSLSAEELGTYFIQTDTSSPKVARLQVKTFQILAEAAGHSVPRDGAPLRSAPTPRPRSADRPRSTLKAANGEAGKNAHPGRSLNLTLHLDLHLPAGADQDTYDCIFKSLREQLLRQDD